MFVQSVVSAFSKYVTFSGRASRTEYWFFALFLFIVGIVTALIDMTVLSDIEWSPLNTIFSLGTFLPSLAISVRRLHDIDRTGWWVLIALTIIGIIVLLIFACTRGTIGSNRFGADPWAGAEPMAAPRSGTFA
jgi:uncharacterized membrane protein YhaH (DUF805 family)